LNGFRHGLQADRRDCPDREKTQSHSLSLHNPLTIGFQKLLVRSAGFFVGLYPQKLHLNIRQAKWLFKLFLERHSIFSLPQTSVCSRIIG